MYTTQRDVQGEEIESFLELLVTLIHIVYTYLQLLDKKFVKLYLHTMFHLECVIVSQVK